MLAALLPHQGPNADRRNDHHQCQIDHRVDAFRSLGLSVSAGVHPHRPLGGGRRAAPGRLTEALPPSSYFHAEAQAPSFIEEREI
jgi:hypothetical protein